MAANLVESHIDELALAIVKLAVTSRMARVPLEKDLPRFLGYPVRAETLRLPSKSTRMTFVCGPFKGRRVCVDQSSYALQQAARTLVRRVLSDVALYFVFNNYEE